MPAAVSALLRLQTAGCAALLEGGTALPAPEPGARLVGCGTGSNPLKGWEHYAPFAALSRAALCRRHNPCLGAKNSEPAKAKACTRTMQAPVDPLIW